MLENYTARTGKLDPVWTLEIQTRPDDVDRILDAALAVHPLAYGRYQRNASVSAVGCETTQPLPGSTTTTHKDSYAIGVPETYPVVEVKISIGRDLTALQQVMDAILDIHHYEEPVIYVREDWASRARYAPNSTNPNRWWNDGRGLPAPLQKG